MVTETDPAEQAAAVVSDPELYDLFADEYSDEISFYSALRANAQRSLSFEEYVELRRVFLERGPTEAVADRLEDRLDRSLKNMVLGNSPRGRAYAVETLAELDDRRRRFDTLDVEVPSLSAVVRTTVEHLYDKVARPADTLGTLSALLSEVPSGDREAVAFVADAWLAETVLAADSPRGKLRATLSTYVETVPAPARVHREDRGATDYTAAAEQRPFADPERRDLYAAALHAAPTVDRAVDYCYQTAADAVEAYRHGEDRVTRADLLLARRHLRLLDTVDGIEDADRRAYADSYRHLADAIEAGGGRWLSDRAGKPAPEWRTVADAYARAAAAVWPVNTVRFVKYLSKAVRHTAHALDDWAHRYRLHAAAGRMFERFEPDPDVLAGQSHSVADVDEAVSGTLRTHRCREYEARAHLAFATLAYDEVEWAADRARAAAASAPQDSLALGNLEAVEALARARQAERHGAFEEALSAYDEVRTDDDELAVGLSLHRQLCELKALVEAGDREAALSTAHEQFGPESAVTVATAAGYGLLPSAAERELTLSDQFLSIDREALSVLESLLGLAETGGGGADLLRAGIHDCLLDL